MRAALNLLGRRSALLFWQLALPLALTVLVIRFPLGSFARRVHEQPIVTAALVFLGFVALVQCWSPYLPGAVAPTGRRRAGRIVLVAAVAVAAIAGIVVARVFTSARVVSTSMVPTVLPDDRVWVDRRAYPAGSAPRRGDVIVFHRASAGEGEQGTLTKRVIAVAGDHVAMVESTPVINGRQVPTCDAGPFAYLGATRMSRGRLVVEWLEGRPYLTVHERGSHPSVGYQVKPGEVFVLGDNRGVSNDSRTWSGAPGVALSAIEGRAGGVLFGTDRGGRLDWERIARRLGTELHVPGVDIASLREGIERCLMQRAST